MSRSSSLIKSCTDKLMVSQWVPHWVRSLRMHVYVILKNSGSQNAPPDILPKVFKRYVDDIFVMFLCQSHLKDVVNYMNTKHPHIKFTSEFEENDSFSFLDIKITRSNNKLVPSVFRKATFSGVFNNLKSFMHVAYKLGLVYTLLHRSFSICSSYEKFHEEMLLKDIFKKNEYPQFFIDKCIKRYLSKLFVPK